MNLVSVFYDLIVDAYRSIIVHGFKISNIIYISLQPSRRLRRKNIDYYLDFYPAPRLVPRPGKISDFFRNVRFLLYLRFHFRFLLYFRFYLLFPSYLVLRD